MSDTMTRLQDLKAKIETGKTEVAKATANLETYAKQRDEIVAQLAELGAKPEGLDAEIERLDKEIEANLAQAEQLLAEC